MAGERQSKAGEASSHAEAADPVANVSQQREDAARRVRYLWPILSSLWQVGKPGALDR
jgi:hypothetical protein